MSDALTECVFALLKQMPCRGLEAAKDLFWSQLNYDRANEPLPLASFAEGQLPYLQDVPTILAQAGVGPVPLRIIHVTLSAKAQGRGFPLSIAAERVIAERLLRDHPYALFLFSDASQRHWHLVNVRDVRGGSGASGGGLRYVMRRIAIGPYERLRTAAERVAMLNVTGLASGTPGQQVSSADLQARHNEAFDVAKVTEQFFKDYVAIFQRLRQHAEPFLGAAEQARDYAQQFLNRLMFLHFVQRKGWLGEGCDFLHNFWRAYAGGAYPQDTFYRDWLHVLFFEALNNQFQAGRADRQYLPEHLRKALASAPFLNGGLFTRTALDRAFSEANGCLPDALVEDVMTTLERYNFTIAEDTPLDQEVAVDPEMLGYVYESLVNVSDDIDERGEAGIFYTPRIEIELMCRLALVERLSNVLGQERRALLYEALFAFTAEQKAEADAHLRQQNLWPALDKALAEITVCDPACGSGSFLVGMLDVLADLQARSDAEHGRDVTPYERKKRIVERSLYGVDIKQWAVQVAALRLWLQLVIETDLAPAELQFRPLLPSLEFKLRVGDSLVQQVAGIDLAHRAGYDISPALKGRLTRLKGRKAAYFAASATGEAHEGERRAIEQETRQIYMAILQERRDSLSNAIKRVEARLAPRKDIFGEIVPEQMGLERVRDEQERGELEEQRREATAVWEAIRRAGELPFVWDVDFVEVFKSEAAGFGIVIGNPPYVRQEAIADPLAPHAPNESADAIRARKAAYKEALARAVVARWPQSLGGGRLQVDRRSDLYVYFYLVGLNLLAKDGAFCFITSNAWLDVGYGAGLQEFLLTRGRVRLVVDNQVQRSFSHADVNTVIVLLAKPEDSSGPCPASLEHVARFVQCRAPFEMMLDPVPWLEIEEARDRKETPEYRVYPARQRWLREQGLAPDSQRYAGDKWGGKYLRAPDIYWTILAKAGDKLVRLGDIAEVRFGIKTGANEFFYLTPTGQPAPEGLVHVRNGAGWEGLIEEEFLRPVVKSPRECPGIVIRAEHLVTNLLLCPPDPCHLAGTHALEYIREAETRGIHCRASLRIRNPWWHIDPDLGPYLWWKSIGERYVFFWNPDEYPTDQRNYFLKPLAADLAPKRLVLSLNSTIDRLLIETTAREMTGAYTIIEMTVQDVVNRHFVLAPAEIEGVDDNFLVRPIQGIFSEVQQPDRLELDQVLFDALGLAQGERDAVYEAVIGLVETRLRKARSV